MINIDFAGVRFFYNLGFVGGLGGVMGRRWVGIGVGVGVGFSSGILGKFFHDG